jgi:hypothetical protein
MLPRLLFVGLEFQLREIREENKDDEAAEN